MKIVNQSINKIILLKEYTRVLSNTMYVLSYLHFLKGLQIHKHRDKMYMYHNKSKTFHTKQIIREKDNQMTITTTTVWYDTKLQKQRSRTLQETYDV